MDTFKDYYANCFKVCTPEKYVIDQSEIEIPSLGKTNLSFRIFDFYSSNAKNLNWESHGSAHNSKNGSSNDNDSVIKRSNLSYHFKSNRKHNKTSAWKSSLRNIDPFETKIKKNYDKEIDKIQVFDDFMLNFEKGKTNENEHKNDSNELGDNRTDYICIENAFDTTSPHNYLLKDIESFVQNDCNSKTRKSNTFDIQKPVKERHKRNNKGKGKKIENENKKKYNNEKNEMINNDKNDNNNKNYMNKKNSHNSVSAPFKKKSKMSSYSKKRSSKREDNN